MACHFAIAGLMASRGHHVDSVDGNSNLKWSITGPPGKGVIACSYIFVAVYGFTWVRSLPISRDVPKSASANVT